MTDEAVETALESAGASPAPWPAGDESIPESPPASPAAGADAAGRAAEADAAAPARSEAGLPRTPATPSPVTGSPQETPAPTPVPTAGSGTGTDSLGAAADEPGLSGRLRADQQAAGADQATIDRIAAEAGRLTQGRSTAAGTAPAALPSTPATAAAAKLAVSPETGTDDGGDGADAAILASEEPASEQPTAAPLQPAAGGPRTRDVIDRASNARADSAGQSPSTAPAQDDVSTGVGSPTPSARQVPATDPAPARLGEPAATTVTATEPAEPPTGFLAPAETTPAEARAAEAAENLSLSTTSRASVETTAQIAAQIVRKLEGRSTRFEMALTPEGLGQVDVSLDIDADGQLAARLSFDNPLAATELRGRVDELRRQLQEAGFTVADDALSFSQRDASAGQGGAFDRRPDPRSARAFGAASRVSAEADLLAPPPRWMSLTLTPDRVDMKV